MALPTATTLAGERVQEERSTSYSSGVGGSAIGDPARQETVWGNKTEQQILGVPVNCQHHESIV